MQNLVQRLRPKEVDVLGVELAMGLAPQKTEDTEDESSRTEREALKHRLDL